MVRKLNFTIPQQNGTCSPILLWNCILKCPDSQFNKEIQKFYLVIQVWNIMVVATVVDRKNTSFSFLRERMEKMKN